VRMGFILPPSFLLLVKEQVACMKDRIRQGCINPAFFV